MYVENVTGTLGRVLEEANLSPELQKEVQELYDEAVEELNQEDNSLTDDEKEALSVIFNAAYSTISILSQYGYDIDNWGHLNLDTNTMYTIAEKLGINID